MKKIAILTWLHNQNYGSILQAYALQRFLKNKGYEVYNIDLNPSIKEKIKNCIEQNNPLLTLVKEKLQIYKARRACKDNVSLNIKNQKFNSFLLEHFSLTKTYGKFGLLKELSELYDAYICGSDQVWSPMLLSPSYFFDFLPDSSKKISYACSFGMSTLPKDKKEKIKLWLSKFHAISVREQSGVDIVDSLLKKKCACTVDPTMLLSSKEWDEVATAKRLIDEPYLLCYFLSFNLEQWEKTRTLSKEKNLKMIVIPTTKESYKFGDKVLCDVGPEDWVGLVKHADFVSTDSFHGCVFSIIYKRQFCVFKRFADTNKFSQNSRIYTLLSTYGLEKCLVKNTEEIQISFLDQTLYDKVEYVMTKKADISKKWLINAIE